MSVLIRYNVESESVGLVHTSVFDPSLFPAKLQENEIIVDEFPAIPETLDGEYVSTTIDLKTKKITHKVLGKSTKNEFQELKERVNLLQSVIDEIVLGGMF